MFWVIIIFIVCVIAEVLESPIGKIVFGSAVAAIGFLLLSWITKIGFLVTLAKFCAIIIVITLTVATLVAIKGCD